MLLRFGLGLGVFLVLFTAALQADDIAPGEVPAVVMAACKAKYPAAEIMKVEKEMEDGKPAYEFKLRQGQRRFEATFDSEGRFMKEEEEKPGTDR